MLDMCLILKMKQNIIKTLGEIHLKNNISYAEEKSLSTE